MLCTVSVVDIHIDLRTARARDGLDSWRRM